MRWGVGGLVREGLVKQELVLFHIHTCTFHTYLKVQRKQREAHDAPAPQDRHNLRDLQNGRADDDGEGEPFGREVLEELAGFLCWGVFCRGMWVGVGGWVGGWAGGAAFSEWCGYTSLHNH